MTEIRRGKALALLVEAAEVTDTAGQPVDLEGLQPDGSLRSDANSVDDENVSGESEVGRRKFVDRGRLRDRS